MKKYIKLEKEILNEIEDFDDEITTIADWGLQTSNNTPITHLSISSSVENVRIGLWCGNPVEDDNAEELIVSEAERTKIYEEILEYI